MAERITVYLLQPRDRPYFKMEWVEPGTGKRRSRSSRTADPALAERARADLEYELNHRLHQEVPATLDWERFREMFESEYVAGQRESSRHKFGCVLDVFEQIVHPGRLGQVTGRTISLFLKGMRERPLTGGRVGLAPWSQRTYLVALKTALGWALRQGFLAAIPEWPKVKVPKKKPQPIPEQDFDKLFAKAPDDLWRAYLLCGWWGGLRLGEALELRRAPSDRKPWLDLAGDRVVFPAAGAKSDEDQWVPLHPTLRAALAALPDTGDRIFPFRSAHTGRPLSGNAVSSRVRDLARQAGVKLSMHRLRKGFGCRVAKKLGRGNAPLLHTLMRHSNMQVTMDFYASVNDVLHEAIREL